MSKAKHQLCHFVSRFLTKDWEEPFGDLLFFDFATGQFGRKNSRRLFAVPDLNSPEIEKRLGQKIETPISEVKQKLIRRARTGELRQDLRQVRQRAATSGRFAANCGRIVAGTCRKLPYLPESPATSGKKLDPNGRIS